MSTEIRRYHSFTRWLETTLLNFVKCPVRLHSCRIMASWMPIPHLPLRMESGKQGFPKGTYSLSVIYAWNCPYTGLFLHTLFIGEHPETYVIVGYLYGIVVDECFTRCFTIGSLMFYRYVNKCEKLKFNNN